MAPARPATTDSPPTPRAEDGRRILFIEDRIPLPALGRGYPRSNRIIVELVRLGHGVTLYPLLTAVSEGEGVHACLPVEVEVAPGGAAAFPAFWANRASSYDLVFVSRPHNKAVLNTVVPAGAPGQQPTIVYDAEAVFCLRDLGLLRRRGQDPPPRYERRVLANEMALVEPSAAVLAVSEQERAIFRQHSTRPVFVVGHALDPAPTQRPLARRQGFLFVGAMSDRWSPNVDAANWMLHAILPTVVAQLGDGIRLVIAGANAEKHVREGSDAVEVRGQTTDLSGLYDAARVFVAPLRYGAGIPIKIQEAAARGVPVVTTSLLAEQLSWQDGIELLVADDAESFAAQCVRLHTEEGLWHALRRNALTRVTSECSPAVFRSRLAHIVDKACAQPPM